MGAELQIADPQPADQEHEERTLQLWQTIGAIKLANSLANSLASQTIHALEKIRDEKLYLASGFRTFDEFLSSHPNSPMSHDTFRRRVNLLQTEGDVVFDLLNSLNVPLTTRKLLSGEVEVNKEQRTIKIADVEIPLSDEPRVIETICAFAKKTAEQARTIERGKKENERHKKKIDKLEDQLSRGGTVSADATPQARALVSVLGAYQLLVQEATAIEDEKEKQRFGALAIEHLAKANLQLEAALGFVQPAAE